MNLYIICEEHALPTCRGYDRFAVVRAESRSSVRALLEKGPVVSPYSPGARIELIGTSPEEGEAILFQGGEGGFCDTGRSRG